ncbi:MAG: AI-2E family transporter [Elusimicrobia bacterium]|nr:AI-2E family transporter [Elusimicrobiota bacterium]
MEQNQKFLKFDKAQVFKFFFFGILIFLLYQLLKILSPFTGAILVSTTLTIVFYPLHMAVKKRVAGRTASSILTTSVVILTVILPILLFGWLLFRESLRIYPRTHDWLANFEQFDADIPVLSKLKNSLDINTGDLILKNLKTIQEGIIKSGGKIVKNIIFFVIDLVAVVFTLFLFFRSGEKLLRWLIDMIPMDYEYKYKIANQLYITTIAVVRGILLTALIQGAAATIGYVIAGLPAPVLLGMLTAFAALIPYGGATLVWLPTGIVLLMTQNTEWGIFILLWGMLIVSLIDNIVRPMLIGKQAKLPFFLLFLAIFGGMRAYGPIGIFLGPLLVSCVITFLQIYRQQTKTE